MHQPWQRMNENEAPWLRHLIHDTGYRQRNNRTIYWELKNIENIPLSPRNGKSQAHKSTVQEEPLQTSKGAPNLELIATFVYLHSCQHWGQVIDGRQFGGVITQGKRDCLRVQTAMVTMPSNSSSKSFPAKRTSSVSISNTPGCKRTIKYLRMWVRLWRLWHSCTTASLTPR